MSTSRYPRLSRLGGLIHSAPSSPETTVLRSPVPHLLWSNVPPSEEERLKIEDVLETVRTEATTLHSRLETNVESSTNLAQAQIRARVDEMESFTRLHESGLSSLRILPNEILAAIFVSCLPSLDSEPWHHRTWRDIQSFRLSQVCRRWRMLAIGTPMLWSILGDIVVNEKTAKKGRNSYLQFIEELLRRSRNADLWIYMTFPDKDYWRDEHSFIDILVKHEARWTAFGISAGVAAIKSICEREEAFTIGPRLSLPRLHKLTLDICRFKGPAIMSIVGFSKAPLLTEVIVSQIPPGILSLPYRQLVTYGESDPRLGSSVMNMKSILIRVLKEATDLARLETFSLTEIPYEQLSSGGGTLVFGSIKTLILKPHFITYDIENLQSPLALPALEELRVKGQHRNLIPFVTSLVRRTISLGLVSFLRKLYLRHIDFFRGDLFRLLSLTPHLEELITDCPPEFDLRKLFAAFKDDHGVHPREVVPRLTVLVLHISLDVLATRCRLISAFARGIVGDNKTFRNVDVRAGPERCKLQDFRLILHGTKSVHEAQTMLNEWNDTKQWSSRPLRNPLIPLCQRLQDVLAELDDEHTTKWKWLFHPKFPQALDMLVREMEEVKLETDEDLDNLYVSRLHLSLFRLTGFRDGYIPQDERYKFRARATMILESWDLAILADLKVRKIQWALKGQRSLLYLTEDDDLHASPLVVDSVYFGLQDDYSDDLMWPDPLHMNEFSC